MEGHLSQLGEEVVKGVLEQLDELPLVHHPKPVASSLQESNQGCSSSPVCWQGVEEPAA